MLCLIYCCKEHAEYGLEQIINETGEAPEIKMIDGEELPTATCEFCGQPAEYIVSN